MCRKMLINAGAAQLLREIKPCSPSFPCPPVFPISFPVSLYLFSLYFFLFYSISLAVFLMNNISMSLSVSPSVFLCLSVSCYVPFYISISLAGFSFLSVPFVFVMSMSLVTCNPRYFHILLSLCTFDRFYVSLSFLQLCFPLPPFPSLHLHTFVSL